MRNQHERNSSDYDAYEFGTYNLNFEGFNNFKNYDPLAATKVVTVLVHYKPNLRH